MAATLRRALWRPGTTVFAGVVLGIVVTALVVHWTDPFLQEVPKPKPVPAPKSTTVLNWNESWEPKDTQGSINFQVGTFSPNKDGTWTLSASVRNQTTKTIHLRPGGSGPVTEAGLAYRVDPATYKPLAATRVQPEMPSKLAPGESWAGLFIGPQKLPGDKDLFASFGTVKAPGEGRYLPYITEHSFRINR
jgi:hypothetical protein